MPITNSDQFIHLLQQQSAYLTQQFGDAFNPNAFIKMPLDTLIKLAAQQPQAHRLITPLIERLIDAGANINQLNEQKETPINCIVKQKLPTNWIQYFIHFGANLNQNDMTGQYPLNNATFQGYDNKTLMILMEATIQQITQHIQTRDLPTEVKERMLTNEINYHALMLMVGQASLDVINALVKKGANFEQLIDNHKPPLSMYIMSLDTIQFDQEKNFNRVFENISLLIKNGANVHDADALGNTPLHYAMALENTQLSKQITTHLLANGANINAQNHMQESALHQLTQMLHSQKAPLNDIIDRFSFLIDQQANIFVEDLEGGRTPFYLLLYHLDDRVEPKKLNALLKKLNRQGVEFFNINPITNAIYFRDINNTLAQAILDVKIEDVLKINDAEEREQYLLDNVLVPIFTMHSMYGKEKMLLFIQTLIKFNIPITSHFIQHIGLLKRDYNETICDDKTILQTLLKHYKADDIDTFYHDMAILLASFDGDYYEIIFDFAVSHIESTFPSQAHRQQFNLLLSTLLLHCLDDDPTKVVTYIDSLQVKSVHIHEAFVNTIIDFKQAYPYEALCSNGDIIQKLLSVYEPTNRTILTTQIDQLKTLFANTPAYNVIDAYQASLSNGSQINSYHAMRENINHKTVGENALYDMVAQNPSMLKAIAQEKNATKAIFNGSPIIQMIVKALLNKSSFSNNLHIPNELRKMVYGFLPNDSLLNTIQSASLFYDKPSSMNEVDKKTPPIKKRKLSTDIKENQTPNTLFAPAITAKKRIRSLESPLKPAKAS